MALLSDLNVDDAVSLLTTRAAVGQVKMADGMLGDAWKNLSSGGATAGSPLASAAWESARNGLIGAGLGGVAGAAHGAFGDEDEKDVPGGAMRGALLGGAVGAGGTAAYRGIENAMKKAPSQESAEFKSDADKNTSDAIIAAGRQPGASSEDQAAALAERLRLGKDSLIGKGEFGPSEHSVPAYARLGYRGVGEAINPFVPENAGTAGTAATLGLTAGGGYGGYRLGTHAGHQLNEWSHAHQSLPAMRRMLPADIDKVLGTGKTYNLPGGAAPVSAGEYITRAPATMTDPGTFRNPHNWGNKIQGVSGTDARLLAEHTRPAAVPGRGGRMVVPRVGAGRLTPWLQLAGAAAGSYIPNAVSHWAYGK